ncbi:MAG: Crp/Fnr family transcriptional regulator [Clostridia bacterium]|nr:Crp/Fnr family transcriptional regulator [Clostridia bacterium]
MKKYLEILRRCPLFRGVEDENLIPMLSCLGVTNRSYRKNEVIFAEGSIAKSFGILLSGEVQIVRVDYYGNRSLVGRVGEGELFGEAFACAEVEALPVDVIASEDCEVLLADVCRVTQTCCNACDFHNKIIYNLMKIVAAKNLMFHRKLEIISGRTTRDKLMNYLLLEAKRAGSNTFEIPYDRQELADYLEVDRSGLSSEISKLRREGVLESEKNRFVLRQTDCALKGEL